MPPTSAETRRFLEGAWGRKDSGGARASLRAVGFRRVSASDTVPRKTLDRELGLLAVMAISMGAMLGSGLFVLPGIAVDAGRGFAGAAMPLAYLISSVVVFPAALCKAELATALPRSGGTYLYVDRGLGPLAGTVVGLGVWFSLVFKAAFALAGLGAYCAFALHLPGEARTFLRALAVVLCLGLMLLNLLGVKKSSALQNGIVCVTLIGLGLFVLECLPRADGGRLFAGAGSAGTVPLLKTSGLVFVSFAGVTKVCSIAEEVRHPSRNLPRGILLSLAVVGLIYVLVTALLVSVLDPAAFAGSRTPLASVAGEVFGPAEGVGMALLAVLTLTSMANSGMLTSSRFPLAMARDRLLPEGLGSIHPRFRTPVRSILLTGAVMGGLVALVDVERLAKLASAFQLLVFAVVNLSVVVLRESGARWYRPAFAVPGYPLTPIVGALCCVGLLAFLGPLAYAGAAGIVSAGLAWYFLYARRRVERRGALTRLYGERRRLSGRVTRSAVHERAGVLVPIFERDEDLEDLIPLAALLAESGEPLKVLRIEEVPDQAALADFADEDPLTRQIAQRVEGIAGRYELDCEFEDVVTHHAKHVLYERAVDERVHWLVMRWQPRSKRRWFVPDPVAWFVHHPPVDLVLFRETPGEDGAGLERFRRVLVCPEPGPHDVLVVHVADRFASAYGAELTFAYAIGADPDDEEEEARVRAYHRGLARLYQAPLREPLLLRGSDEAEAVRAASRDFDLLVLGAPPENESMLRRSFEDRVTEGAACAVLRVKAVRGSMHTSLQKARQPAHSRPPGQEPQPRLPSDPGFRLGDVLDAIPMVGEKAIRTKGQLFAAIAAGFRERHGYDPGIEAALWAREEKQSTALGKGVAVPHATIDALDRLHVELWLLGEPIDFEKEGEDPVDVVFVVLSPPGLRRRHLRALARIGHLILLPEFLSCLRAARSPEDIRDLVETHEDELGTR
ncbi:MAG: amino acid permease [Planctomycetota bacterium]|nr:MAG: amino acid permease [Planctomycetota bacterium]